MGKIQDDTYVISEKEFEGQVKELALRFGWRYYHTWRSIHSPAGFPDCVLVRPPRLVFAELKSEVGEVSPAQEEWLADLREIEFAWDNPDSPVEVYLWRPSDFEQIAEVLR